MNKTFYDTDLKDRSTLIIRQKAGQYEWETPQPLFDSLDAEFHFTLDPCATEGNTKCSLFFTPEMNGLSQDWGTNIVFMNPPYGRAISKWVRKAYNASLAGATVVCLLPARTDTGWWWDYCMKGEIRFIRGRVKFSGRNTKGVLVSFPATFSSAIVVFKTSNLAYSPRMFESDAYGELIKKRVNEVQVRLE